MITGWGGEIDQEGARSRDVDRILAKPFDVPSLVRTVLEALAPRCAADEG